MSIWIADKATGGCKLLDFAEKTGCSDGEEVFLWLLWLGLTALLPVLVVIGLLLLLFFSLDIVKPLLDAERERENEQRREGH